MPTFFDRSEWGALPPKRATPLPVQPATLVVIHHSAGNNPTTDHDQIATVQAIQRYHMVNRGWSDIAYSFLIAKNPGDGGKEANRFEGRGWGVQSGGTGYPQDTYSYSMCALGNFENHRANNRLIRAIVDQINNGIEKGHIAKNPVIQGDYKYNSTACPGKRLIKRIPEIRKRTRS